MLCETPATPPFQSTVTFLKHGGIRIWTDQGDVIREATVRDVVRYTESEVPRGLDCKDEECWCRTHELTKAAREKEKP